jgi:prepilin-type processing-associated H-X9-DG protein
VYLTENEDQFPPFRLYKTTPDTEEYYVNGYGRRAPRWQWFLETELGPVINPTPHQWAVVTKGHFGDYTPRRRGGPKGSTMSHGVFTCPSLKDEQYAMDIRDGAFGYNYQYLGNTRRDTTETRWDNFSVGLHKIRKTGMTVLVADSRGAGFYHGRHSYTLDPPRLATERRATRFGPNRTKYVEPSAEDWPDEEADDCEANAEGGLGDLPQGLGSDPAEVYAYSPVEARHDKRGNVLFADTHAAAMTLTELGYHLSDGTDPVGVRRGVPIPSRDPTGEGSTATNKLWNGLGVDPMAAQPHAQPPGP